MIRGTTPSLTFTLPFDTTNIEVLWVTFSQDNNEVFTLLKSDCVLDGNTITVNLTQSQTLSLLGNQMVHIQVRIKTSDGKALASNILTTSVQRILKDGEI